MAYRLSLEEFDEVSRDFEELLQGLFDPEYARECALYRLAIWGRPGCREVFNGYYDHIVTLEGGTADVVSCKPWDDSLASIVMPTAHECAALLLETLYLDVFGDDGFPVKDLCGELHKRVDEQMDELVDKVERLSPHSETTDIYKVAARMNRERVLVMANPPEWAKQRGRPGYLVAEMKTKTGLENNALNRYVKIAGVETPSVGAKNFRYSVANAKKILETIMAESADKEVIENCRISLDNLR